MRFTKRLKRRLTFRCELALKRMYYAVHRYNWKHAAKLCRRDGPYSPEMLRRFEDAKHKISLMAERDRKAGCSGEWDFAGALGALVEQACEERFGRPEWKRK